MRRVRFILSLSSKQRLLLSLRLRPRRKMVMKLFRLALVGKSAKRIKKPQKGLYKDMRNFQYLFKRLRVLPQFLLLVESFREYT